MLTVRNGARAVDFYKAAFAATELFRFDDESGAVIAQLAVGGADLWLADEPSANAQTSEENFNFSPESLGGSSARMILVVDNPDAVFDRALAAGAKVVWPVDDKSYHWRLGRLVDPFGHHWEIGKPI